MPRRICVVSGSRADFGHLVGLLARLRDDPEIELLLVATCMHLAREFGHTREAIEAAGFRIDAEVEMLEGDDTPAGIARALGRGVAGFSEVFERLAPDLLVVMGDRFEMLAAAQAALIHRISVAHINGGDTTEGAFDEAIRHSITKMSHLHFVTHSAAYHRVRQLGENPRFIFNTGSPALDRIRATDLLSRADLEHALEFPLRRRNLLITFHPVTLATRSSLEQQGELLAALDGLGEDVGLIFTRPNADPEGLELARRLESFVSERRNARLFASLGERVYLSALRHADAVVGNSSSGIYEAPSLETPTVNIGDRQRGRPLATSVLQCDVERHAIRAAIERAFSLDCTDTANPFGDGGSAERIYRVLRHSRPPVLQKRFTDLLPDVTGRAYVIAEAGVNHNGSLERARRMIEVAHAAGADCVKFQAFTADTLASKAAPKARYQEAATGGEESQWEMLKRLELTPRMHCELIEHAERIGIDYLCTAFDIESVWMLAGELGVTRLKIPSGELTNAPLLLEFGRTGLPLVLSTGMATSDEIEEALGVLAFAYADAKGTLPGAHAFREAFESEDGQRALRERVVLLHCVSQYPTPIQDMNLLAIDTLAAAFGLPVGLSDHSLGATAAVAAVARGARMIEKHFTLDRDLPGPDHRASMIPEELASMIRSIREVEQALGSGNKVPAEGEVEVREVARKSLVAARAIRRGEPFTEENLTIKRPGTGTPPSEYWSYLGRVAEHDYAEDELIS